VAAIKGVRGNGRKRNTRRLHMIHNGLKRGGIVKSPWAFWSNPQVNKRGEKGAKARERGERQSYQSGEKGQKASKIS